MPQNAWASPIDKLLSQTADTIRLESRTEVHERLESLENKKRLARLKNEETTLIESEIADAQDELKLLGSSHYTREKHTELKKWLKIRQGIRQKADELHLQLKILQQKRQRLPDLLKQTRELEAHKTRTEERIRAILAPPPPPLSPAFKDISGLESTPPFVSGRKEKGLSPAPAKPQLPTLPASSPPGAGSAGAASAR